MSVLSGFPMKRRDSAMQISRAHQSARRDSAAIAGMTAENSRHFMVARASGLAVKDRQIAHVSAFDAWLTDTHPHHRGKVDGRKLRRMVVMKRDGSTHDEIRRAVGMSQASVSVWLRELPEHLS